MSKKVSLLVAIAIILVVFAAVSLFLYINLLTPNDIRIVSVNYNKNPSTEEYDFSVVIKNIGFKNADYTVHLYNYRVENKHLDDYDVSRGFLAVGDSTTITLSTGNSGGYFMFDVDIIVYCGRDSDKWSERIIDS